MKRYVIFVLPVAVIGITAAVPVLYGDHPVTFAHGTGASPSAASALPGESPSGSGSAAAPSASASYDGPRVARVWQPGTPEWGVQVYWLDDPADPENFVQGKADRIVKYLVDLNANAMAVSFPVYTGGRSSTELEAQPTTPTPERLAVLLDTAQRAGLRTTVRPILDEVSLKPAAGGWRGNITPADKDAWFTSYGKLLTPYLKMAKEHHAAAFTLGTEFNSLEGDPHWQGLVDQAHRLFDGELGYDANFDSYISGPVDIPLPDIGVDAYFPAKSAADDAPVSELVASWNKWLDRKGKGALPTTMLTEVGIPAQEGAYKKPGDFYAKRALNEAVQANWYQAVCQVAQQRKLAGVYFWSAYFGTDPNKKADQDTPRMEFAGRPDSEKAIRDCFAGSYQVPKG
ncbi:glycoside hydrolase family 113 [Kitasatospora sp. NPDC059571]|uniref:glycoside hydrolase family 113 n=1 Tax=Kitasatospora sp. NPDC059571 TaxID=3346871 RepID=UPI0036AE11B7